MARQRAKDPMDAALQDAPASGKTDGNPAEDVGRGGAAGGATRAARVRVRLPEKRSQAGSKLTEKSILIHGPAGIGKSTLASEFGDVFFFDIAGELNELDVFKSSDPPITDWSGFREYCAAVRDDALGDRRFVGCAIDTADALVTLCKQAMRQKHGYSHESEPEWGKGWEVLREEYMSHIHKLAAIPSFGLILVSHSREVEIKTRSAAYTMMQPSLPGVRGAVVDAMDIVLHVGWAEDDETRVIRTKPSRYAEAKERARVPRLPAEIEWPLGASGFDVLHEAWKAGGGE